MLNFLSERRVPAFAGFLLFSFLLLLSAQIRAPDWGARLQSGLLALVSPIARGGASTVQGVGGVWNGYVDLRGVRAENERLRREVAELRVQEQRLDELRGENDRLAEVLKLKKALALETEAARVISLTLTGPFRTAILDRGWRSRIAIDDPVVTPEGVVGRVTAVTGSMAKVQLITDFSSGAAAVLQRNRVQGLVVGLEVNEMQMRFVSSHAEVAPGDWVNTSGLDGIYPAGLRLGRVTALEASEGLEQRVRVSTSVDFRTLEEVLVIVGGEQPAVFPGAAGASR